MSPSLRQAVSVSRRVALGAIAATGAGVILWPGSIRNRPRPPQGRVEVTYWEKWTGREGEALAAIVDRYNQSQSRAWVTLVPVSDITSKAMVAIGGGDPPDIVGLYTYNVPGYAEAGAVLPLEDFAPLDHDAAPEERQVASRYLPGIRDLLTHRSRLWAGVNTCYTLALYYNPALLREGGLDRPPRTIAELDTAADRLTTRDSGGIQRAGFLQNLPGWWPYIWPFLFGGHLYDEAQDKATIAEPECLAAFDWIGASAERFGRAASRSFAGAFGRSIHSAEDPFISGRVAMIVQGPWLVNFLRAYRPEAPFACAPVPVIDNLFDEAKPTGLLEADILMIPRGSRHPEEAYRFLRYMQRQDVQEDLARRHFKPSPLADVSAGFLETHPSPTISVHQQIARSPRARILPRTRVWKQYADLINSAFDAAWSGSPAAIELERVRVRAQELMDTAAARRRARPPTRGASA